MINVSAENTETILKNMRAEGDTSRADYWESVAGQLPSARALPRPQQLKSFWHKWFSETPSLEKQVNDWLAMNPDIRIETFQIESTLLGETDPITKEPRGDDVICIVYHREPHVE